MSSSDLPPPPLPPPPPTPPDHAQTHHHPSTSTATVTGQFINRAHHSSSSPQVLIITKTNTNTTSSSDHQHHHQPTTTTTTTNPHLASTNSQPRLGRTGLINNNNNNSQTPSSSSSSIATQIPIIGPGTSMMTCGGGSGSSRGIANSPQNSQSTGNMMNSLVNGVGSSNQAIAGVGVATPPISSSTAAATAAAAATISSAQQVSIDETPTKLVYKRIETLIEKMQEETSGVPIRTVKNFMAKIPSVCTGTDIIQWVMKKIEGVEDAYEALHFAHLISSHGYIFPIDDHILTVKNDGTFYRFQTPYYWPSHNAERDNTDYAVYLCKRTMQNKTRLELADYEAENLAKLQKLLSKKWEFIYMQAEAQIKVDKKRDKQERKILDSQERAFWDVYRPAPGCLNTTEEDIKKTMRTRRTDFPNIGFFGSRQNIANATAAAKADGLPTSLITLTPPSPTTGQGVAQSSSSSTTGAQPRLAENDEVITIENLRKEKDFLRRRLERRYVKTSKVSESYTNYFEQYIEFDPFITPPDPVNPWISDSTEFWDMEKSLKDIPQRRVRRWGFSIHELLKDQSGRELFRRFLEREFSSENLRFYEVCNELRYASNKGIANKINDIYTEFLGPHASCPINIDSRIMAITKTKMENPDRYTYDEAREHIFNLMTKDSYNRFLRSDAYKESLASAKKKPKPVHPGRMSIVRPILQNAIRE